MFVSSLLAYNKKYVIMIKYFKQNSFSG